MELLSFEVVDFIPITKVVSCLVEVVSCLDGVDLVCTMGAPLDLLTQDLASCHPTTDVECHHISSIPLKGGGLLHLLTSTRLNNLE